MAERTSRAKKTSKEEKKSRKEEQTAETRDETSTGKSIVREILKKFFLAAFVLIFLAILVLGIWFYNKYGKKLLILNDQAEFIASRSKREDFRASQTSICFYADGSVMQVLKGEKNTYYLEYDAIPLNAVNAMLALEDRKFFSHKGYDIYAIARAARAYLEHDGEIRQGGSTITQQLARSTYLTNEKTVERKASEIFLAAKLEQKYSKYDILEFYLNNIYFANGYYGIQAASIGYFSVPANELDLSHIAFLCGIPNSPSSYDPRRNFDNAMLRRDSVLKQMYDSGFISREEYNYALTEAIEITGKSGGRNNYEETYTYYCAIRALMQEEGFSIRNEFLDDADRANYTDYYQAEYDRLQRSLYTKGYRIYTSINKEKQKQLQEAIDNGLVEFDEKDDEGIYKMQASGVCIDNETGLVAAIIGGRGQEYNGYTLNRAYQSARQPGSSIKPLIVYTPYFEDGHYPDSKVVDERFPGGPRNSGNVYSGEIDVRYAVAVSKNTVAWKLLEEIGITRGLHYLIEMDYAHLVEADYVPAASLGGLTYGTTAVEMTSAFATIANGGVFRTPTCISMITDADGNVIIDNTSLLQSYYSSREERRVYQRNAALMMTDVLQTVMRTGTGKKLILNNNITCAGKTGTTNDQKDGWFLGFTGYYTTGIWVGYDYPREVDTLMGNTYPGRIWQDFMNRIHEGFEDKAFEPYVDNRPPELLEAESGEDEEEVYPYGWTDTDGDGIPDGYPDIPTDFDGDGVIDYYPDTWLDYNGDGIPDGTPEMFSDYDGDGEPDVYPYGWVDNDGDGIPDGYPEMPMDFDGDGIIDFYPPEDENEGDADDAAEGDVWHSRDGMPDDTSGEGNVWHSRDGMPDDAAGTDDVWHSQEGIPDDTAGTDDVWHSQDGIPDDTSGAGDVWHSQDGMPDDTSGTDDIWHSQDENGTIWVNPRTGN